MAVDRRLLLPALAMLPAVALADSWPQPPLPDGTKTADVAQHMVFNGLDMHAQVFRSNQTPAQVVAFYRNTWNGRVVVNPLGDAQVIGHRDGDYYVTIQVSPAGGGSKGNIGVVDVADAPHDFQPGKGLPRPMGSTVFNDIAYPDDRVPARTVAMTNALSPRQNAAWFRERLAGEGWKNVDDNRCAQDACVLGYERGDSHLALVATRTRDGHSQVVLNVQQP